MQSLPSRAALAVSILSVLLSAAAATALGQYPPAPVVTLGAPLPPAVATVQPASDTPPLPFLGARYSLHNQPNSCPSFNYYAPGYVAPMFYDPRYREAGPYYYTRSYPYAQSYYNYYYTPGFFRY